MLLGSGFRAKKNGLATALAFRCLRERHSQRPGHPSGKEATVPPLPRGEGRGEGACLARAAGKPPSPARPIHKKAGSLSPRERSGQPTGILFAEEPQAEREALRLWGIEGVEVRPSCGQPAYWPQAAACALALHLDYRRTIGRFSAECAALGVPCISTSGATMQRALWPELIVEPWDVEGASALAERLLRDPAFRGRVVARAARALEPFDLAPMAARFHQALARFVG